MKNNQFNNNNNNNNNYPMIVRQTKNGTRAVSELESFIEVIAQAVPWH
jgi:hypothetical protein